MSNLPSGISLDSIFTNSTQIGSVENAAQRIFYGLDHRQMGLPVPQNKESQPLLFFTRPQLNLTKENARATRQFIPLLTTESMSYQRAVRCLLDPRLHYNNNITSPMVDPLMAFIPILGNTVLSLSGWPGFNLESYTSRPGVYKEVFSMVDGISDFYGAYTLSANFRNIMGDPISFLFAVWCLYQQEVFKGTMMPYPDFIVRNEIEYNSCVWALVLDYTRTYVQKIARTGAMYPTGIDIARSFDFTREGKAYSDATHEVSIQFQANGFCFNDPILIHEFNEVVEIFNPDMWDDNRAKSMKQIPMSQLSLFNGQGYPRIDPVTSKLEWYVRKDIYLAKLNEYNTYYKTLHQGLTV